MAAEQSRRAALRRVGGHWFLAVVAAWFATSAFNDAAGQDPPPPPTSAPQIDSGAQANGKPLELLLVPYQDLKGTINDLGASIMVPLKDWLELQQRLRTKPVDAPAVITAAEYHAVVEKDIARVRAVLKVNVLGKPWAELPLNFGDAAIARLEGNDESVVLRGDGDGKSTLLLGKAGEHTITLQLVARVRTLPDGRQLLMAVPPVAVTTFELEVPEADQTVEIEPKQATVPVEGPMGKTRIRADLGATGRIAAKWFPKASIKPEMELLASVTNDQSVSVEDGLIHRDAWLKFEILRGQLAQIRIAVPKVSRVLDVSGDPRIRGWKTADEAKRQVVTIDLLASTSEAIPVEVHTESPLAPGPFVAAGLAEDGEAFGIHALDVIRENGHVAVRAGSGSELTIAEQQRLARVDAAQTPEKLRADGSSAFRYFSPGFVLKAEVKPIEPRLTVTHQAQLVFHDEELRVHSQLTYSVERAGVFELRIKLPEGLVIDDVHCAAMREFRVDDSLKTLVLTLSQRQQGQIQAVVKGHRPLAAMADAEQALPVIEPQGVEREIGSIYVFAKPSVEVITSEGGVSAAQPLAAPAGMLSGDAALTSSWSFTRRPVTIPVKITRKPARLSADVATSAQVRPQFLEVETQLTFQTQYAGLDTFRLMAPAAVSDRLRIESLDSATPLRQKTAGAPENGWVTWTVVMQREVLGAVRLKLSYDLRDTPAAGGAAPAAATLALIRPIAAKASGGADVPLTRVVGQLSISKDDTIAVTATATGGDVEPIDVRELTLLPQTGATAFRYFRQPDDRGIDVTINRTRNEVQAVVATVIRRGLVEVVTGDKAEAAATFRCRYRMKSSERQRLLVHLPVNLELLGSFVNARDVRLEKANLPAGQKVGESWDAYWLNVAREGSNEDEFVVTLNFLWKLSPALGGGSYARGSLELPLPVFGAIEAPAAVQEQRVAVWTPRDYVLVGRPKNFQPLTEPELCARMLGRTKGDDTSGLEAWLDPGPAPTSTLPRDGRTSYVYSNIGGASRLRVDWWQHLRVTVIASFALLLIALVLVRTSWENKLGILLFGLLGITLYGLSDRYAAAETLAAARYGLVFLIGLWLVELLFGWRRRLANSSPTATQPVVVEVSSPPPAPPGGP